MPRWHCHEPQDHMRRIHVDCAVLLSQSAFNILSMIKAMVCSEARLCTPAPTSHPHAVVCAPQIEMSRMDMAAWPGRTHAYLQVPVLYPFGHGLTYTSSRTTDVRALKGSEGQMRGFQVAVQNTGGELQELSLEADVAGGGNGFPVDG